MYHHFHTIIELKNSKLKLHNLGTSCTEEELVGVRSTGDGARGVPEARTERGRVEPRVTNLSELFTERPEIRI